MFNSGLSEHNQHNESHDEFYDCSEESESESECKGERDLLGKIYYEDEERMDSVVSARLFVNNIQNYLFNRTLNQKHVKFLADKILESGRVLDAISVGRDPDYKLRILNGQHRVEALKQLLLKYPSLDYPLHITTYTVPTLTSTETFDLFNSLNCNMNLKKNPVLDNVHQIVVKLQSDFPKAIIDQKSRCQRPRVDTRRLKERFELKLLNQFSEPIDVDRFYELIIKENANYGLRSIQDLFGNKKKNNIKRFEKATEFGWYLTMRDMNTLPNEAHKDENGNLLFDDSWIDVVIEKYKNCQVN